MKHVKALLVILFLMLVVIIVAQNIPNLEKPVVFTVNLWFFDYQTSEIPLGFLAVITFLIGILSMGFFGILERFRLKKQVKMLRAEIKEMERDIHSLNSTALSTELVNSEDTSEM
jgi:uncharacterized integral membrane protein